MQTNTIDIMIIFYYNFGSWKKLQGEYTYDSNNAKHNRSGESKITLSRNDTNW